MKQWFTNPVAVQPSQSGTRYAGLTALHGFSATVEIVRQPWSVAGTFRNFVVRVSVAPGVGKSWTFTIRKNNADTAVTCTISGTDTTARDIAHDLTAVPGDYFEIKCVPSGSPAVANAGWSLEFEGSTANQSGYGMGILQAAATTVYNGVFCPTWTIWNATRANAENVVPTGGAITRLDVRNYGAPGAGKSIVVALVKNGVVQDGAGGTVDTRATITGAALQAYAEFDLSVVAGDLVALQCTTSGSPSFVYVGWGVRFVATIDGEAIVCGGGSNQGPANYATLYAAPPDAVLYEVWSATETDVAVYGAVAAFTVSKLRCVVSAQPGAGKSWGFSLRRDGASPAGAPSVSIADAATTGTDASGQMTVEDGQYWTLRSVPSNSPANATVRWGMVQKVNAAPAPTVGSITPGHGSELGGTPVTITGTGFIEGATVLIGGEAATDVVVVSDAEITCVTAAHAPATVDVVVTNPDAQFGTLAAGYTYDPLPELPTLVATALDYQTIRLEWADVNYETGYELQWGLDGISYVPLSNPPAGATGATHGAREQLTRYYYRLRAVNAAGASDWSYDDATTPIAPEYHPDPGEDRTGETIGLVWEEICNADGDLECYSDVERAINDPPTYYGGRKHPRVMRWGQIERALSDYRGLYEGATFGAVHTDGDWHFRTNHATKLYAAASVVWRTISEAGRQAKLLARTLVRGIVSEVKPLGNRQFEIVCADVLSRHFGVGNDERQIPKRTLSRTQFADLPTDQVGKPEPIVFGALSDEGSSTAPPVLTGDAAEGAYSDGGYWMCGFAPVTGCLAAPPSGLTCAAVAGGSLALDVQNGEYGLMATSVDINGVESDPVPITNDHATGGSRGGFAAPTPYAQVTAGNQQIDAAWVVGAGAAKTRIYLGTFYYGFRPDQVIEVAAPGNSCSFSAGPGFLTPATPDNITPGAAVPTWSSIRHYRIVAVMPDGRTGLSQEATAVVRGFRRTARPRWLPVAGATAYEVYGRWPAADFDRAWTVSGSPLETYVDDDFLDSAATIISGAPAATGQVPVVYVGTEDISGGIWYRFLVAGHACKSILAAYQGGVRVDAGVFGVTWLVPGRAGWPFGTSYRDINGRRYTLIYLRGPDAQAAIDGTRPITLNVEGGEDAGDGTGALITSLPLQERWFLRNFGFGDYQSGALLASPAFPADPAPEDADVVKQIDDDSFDTCASVLAARVAGGGAGAGMFGAGGEFATLREALARFHVSGGYNCAINRRTQFMVSAFDDRAAALTAARVFTEAREIDAGSFSIQTLDAEHFNARPYTHSYDYARGQWGASGEEQDAASITRYGVTRRGEPMQLWFVRASTLAEDLAQREVARTADPPTRCTFSTPAVGFNAELGDLVLVTHTDGVGAAGWVNQPVRLQRHVTDPGNLGTMLGGEDVGARMVP